MIGDGALIVFAREPVAGKVKTRLAATLGAEVATKIYAQLLDRTIDIATQSQFSNCYLYASQPRDLAYFQGRLDSRQWQVRVQCGGDIGQRMADAIRKALVDHSFVAVIGSDVADLLTVDLNAAYTTLGSAGDGAVVGPSADGGYWLIGVRRMYPELFCQMHWSTEDVARTTLERFENIGVEVAILAERHDVDESSDLQFMPGWVDQEQQVI